MERTLQIVAERAAQLLSASLVTLALFEEAGEAFVFEAAAGRGARRVLGMRVPAAETMLGQVALTGRAEIVEDVARDERVNLRVLQTTGGRTGLWAPLLAGERAIGGLIAFDPVGGGSFGPSDLRVAESIGHGLRNMADRARALGGHLDVHSRPGDGTRIDLVVPLGDSTQETRRLPSRQLKCPGNLGILVPCPSDPRGLR